MDYKVSDFVYIPPDPFIESASIGNVCFDRLDISFKEAFGCNNPLAQANKELFFFYIKEVLDAKAFFILPIVVNKKITKLMFVNHDFLIRRKDEFKFYLFMNPPDTTVIKAAIKGQAAVRIDQAFWDTYNLEPKQEANHPKFKEFVQQMLTKKKALSLYSHSGLNVLYVPVKVIKKMKKSGIKSKTEQGQENKKGDKADPLEGTFLDSRTHNKEVKEAHDDLGY